jgi:hypothetical protein
LLLFLSFKDKQGQAVFIYVREMIFTAKVQIILKPFFILPFQVVGDGLVPQTLFKF